MLTNKYSGAPLYCPYCNSIEKCDHLFAFYDVTFNSINGGYIFYKDDINVLLYDFFNRYIESNGFTKKLDGAKHPVLNDMWNVIYDSRTDLIFDEKNRTYDFDLPARNQFIFQVLDEIEVPEEAVADDFPGLSSSYLIYYAEHPHLTYKTLINSIKVLLM